MAGEPGTPGAAALLRRTVAGQRRAVGSAAAMFMSWQACEALVPVAVGAVVDHAIEPHDGRAAIVWTVALGALFLTLSMSYRFGARASARASAGATHAARAALAARLLDPTRPADPGQQAGNAVTAADQDAQRVGQLASSLALTCGSVVSLAVTAVALLRISVPLGLLVLIGTPPLLLAMRALGVPLERRSGDEQTRAAEATHLASDVVSGLRVLKGMGAEAAAAARFRTAARRSLTATLRAARAESAYDAATLLLTLLFLALVALVGGRFAAEGRITVGDLVAAVGLAQFLLGPLSQLSSTGAVLARARASAARLAAFAADGPQGAAAGMPGTAGAVGADVTSGSGEGTDPSRADGLRGRAGAAAAGALRASEEGESGADTPPRRARELRFPLDDAGREASVAAGEFVGIAAGPEIAARLIDRFAGAAYDLAVLVDGEPLAAVPVAVRHRAMITARHGEVLFGGTIRENITAAVRDAERLELALLASGADQVAATQPEGLDTPVTGSGSSLSGGQRQRVALARALAADPDVLVLHDPTTAVDAATEARIATGLRRVRLGRTTVLVTTSPALLAVCDRVLVPLPDAAPLSARHHDLTPHPAYRSLVLA